MTPVAARARFVPFALVLALWSLALAVDNGLSRAARRSPWFAAQQTAGSPAALAQLAGSFRVVGANVLWLKVDAYHDEWEARGRDWTQNADLLPLLRAITYLDPHFVEAYGVHAFLLAHNRRPDDALRLLAEGSRNNPRAPDLYEAAGMVWATRLNRSDKAVPCFARALALSSDPFERRRLARTLSILRARTR